jgi:hypothetical protein
LAHYSFRFLTTRFSLAQGEISPRRNSPSLPHRRYFDNFKVDPPVIL